MLKPKWGIFGHAHPKLTPKANLEHSATTYGKWREQLLFFDQVLFQHNNRGGGTEEKGQRALQSDRKT